MEILAIKVVALFLDITVPSSNGHIPLLWFPVDISILEDAFYNTAAAFGCIDGRVIILDFTQLSLQDAL